jgi:hypothetical protein
MILAALDHHARSTLGDGQPKDVAEALRDLRDIPRRLSVLRSGGVKFWVLTEGDPPVTTVLLPEEF